MPAAPRSLRTLCEHLPMPACIVDDALVTTDSNPPWAAMFGPGGGPWSGDPTWRARLESALRAEQATVVQHAHDDPDQGTRHLRWQLTPWSDDHERGLVVTATDITGPVETRRRLQESEALVQAFFDQAPIGLNLCRTDGLWLESNPAFLDIIGYSAHQADGGLTYWQLTPRRYDDDEARQLKNLEATGRYGPYEKEFVRRDGTLVPVRLNGFYVERDGTRYIWSLIEDLTEQRALEAELEEERLSAIQASKLATIGELAAGFAHEVNNPLAIIEAYAFELEHAAARGDTALIGEAITAIRDATERAGHIVRSLKRLAGGASTDASPHRVAELVEEAVELAAVRMRRAGVALHVDNTATGWVRVHPVEMIQILLNLLNNGFDAVHALDDRQVWISSEDAPAGVCVVVSDSGGGVPDQVRDHLFEPFITTKPVGKGTGLGLSISRRIAESAGGTLSWRADAPRTTFVLSLPGVEPP